jgi:hypothetical protein
MSAPRLVLKQTSGWFAAGWQFGEALRELSDAAFKLYVWLCLDADRHTGRARITAPELAVALRKPRQWIEPALEELLDRGVCRRVGDDLLEVEDHYWPYEKQLAATVPEDYLGQVRRMLLAPACVQARFTPADERLALDLQQRGVTVIELQRAVWLGCARKYAAMLNGQPPMPISSLRYFLGLIEEVGEMGTPDSYWEHVRRKVGQLERQWLDRSRGASTLAQ